MFQDACPIWEISDLIFTIVRRNSTSMIEYSSPFLEAWNRYWRILWLSLHFSLLYQCLFCRFRSQSAIRWCQKFFEFTQRAENSPSRAGWLSKKFPELPTVSRVVGANSESRLGIPLELDITIGWPGTWDVPEQFAVSGSWKSFASAKEFTRLCKSWSWASNWFTVVGSLFYRSDNSLFCNFLSRFASS